MRWAACLLVLLAGLPAVASGPTPVGDARPKRRPAGGPGWDVRVMPARMPGNNLFRRVGGLVFAPWDAPKLWGRKWVSFSAGRDVGGNVVGLQVPHLPALVDIDLGPVIRYLTYGHTEVVGPPES